MAAPSEPMTCGECVVGVDLVVFERWHSASLKYFYLYALCNSLLDFDDSGAWGQSGATLRLAILMWRFATWWAVVGVVDEAGEGIS